MTDVTRILQQIDDGDPSATEKLLPLVYDELRKLAARELAQERSDHTLQPTALVHEAYLRLVGSGEEKSWASRGQFYVAAARAIRRILIDSARRKRAIKRGGDQQQVPLNEQLVAGDAGNTDNADLLAIEHALQQLEQIQPELAELVLLRYFAGLTMPQAAQSLQIPLRTAERKWTYAKAWLLEALAAEHG